MSIERTYKCVVADPPWNESGGGGRGAQNHYDLIPNKKEIAAIMAQFLGIGSIFTRPGNVVRVAGSAHLWLWVTDTFLEDGLWIAAELGFTYKRTFVWVKEQDRRPQIGLGQYARGQHEICLFCSKGTPNLPEPARRPNSVLFAPRTRHSSKPLACYDQWFERVSHGPRVELFAREKREGWDCFGDDPSLFGESLAHNKPKPLQSRLTTQGSAE